MHCVHICCWVTRESLSRTSCLWFSFRCIGPGHSQEKQVAKSKYEEDLYLHNHTSVWGSYWEAGKWGYECCHQFVKSSYCLGAAGKNADNNVLKQIEANAEKVSSAVPAPDVGNKLDTVVKRPLDGSWCQLSICGFHTHEDRLLVHHSRATQIKPIHGMSPLSSPPPPVARVICYGQCRSPPPTLFCSP